MARRKSAGTLLNIACIVTPMQYDYAALVLPHSPRWRSLEVEKKNAKIIKDLMSGRMPNLRSLSVLWAPDRAGPPRLRLDQTTYRLRDLTIQCCSLSGFQFTFPYLRRLDLFGLFTQGPSVDQVVAVLAGCAGSLEVLSLVNSIIWPHHGQFCLKSGISLLKLKDLTLGGIRGASMAQILALIELPSSVTALVNIEDHDIRGSEVLDQVARPIISIANIVEGETFRVILGRLAIVFAFRDITLRVGFAGGNGHLPTSDEVHEILRAVLQG
ncbi:hypothetical protein M407DRAFT_21353 [Tulasnella calospora MUT 4182]|uniref:Uncharacterized protein n=1 Tax=Tulasnella calospora MUT 4182 TaxID=1051891 RepID=A0A0C3QEA3_9AGAM|nr:hypothetical protein M407DRAFT_21353 [Tulasnella calospora MUT 4182]